MSGMRPFLSAAHGRSCPSSQILACSKQCGAGGGAHLCNQVHDWVQSSASVAPTLQGKGECRGCLTLVVVSCILLGFCAAKPVLPSKGLHEVSLPALHWSSSVCWHMRCVRAASPVVSSKGCCHLHC